MTHRDHSVWVYNDLHVPLDRVKRVTSVTGGVYRIHLQQSTITRLWTEAEYAGLQWALSVYRYRQQQNAR